MTDDDLPVRDRPVPAKRTLLDELHRFRYYALLVATLLVATLALYVWLGTPGFGLLLLGLAVSTGSAGVAAVVGLPFAFIFASEPDQYALMYLNNNGELDAGVEFFTEEEWDALSVRWGELQELKDTAVQAQMALRYDPERHAAWGTHRAIMSPDELEAALYQSEAIYEDQEEELAELRQMKFIGRTLVRRATEEQLDENSKLYNEFTMPAGDTVGDVWEEMAERKPDQANDGEPSDQSDDHDEQLDQEDVDALDDYLGDLEEDQTQDAAADGGEPENGR